MSSHRAIIVIAGEPMWKDVVLARLETIVGESPLRSMTLSDAPEHVQQSIRRSAQYDLSAVLELEPLDMDPLAGYQPPKTHPTSPRESRRAQRRGKR